MCAGMQLEPQLYKTFQQRVIYKGAAALPHELMQLIAACSASLVSLKLSGYVFPDDFFLAVGDKYRMKKLTSHPSLLGVLFTALDSRSLCNFAPLQRMQTVPVAIQSHGLTSLHMLCADSHRHVPVPALSEHRLLGYKNAAGPLFQLVQAGGGPIEGDAKSGNPAVP